MIISDLNHLEVVTETASVVGAGGYKKCPPKKKPMARHRKKPLVILIPTVLNKQSNSATINQTQEVKAFAVSKYGNATAVAAGGDQSATVGQDNTAAFL